MASTTPQEVVEVVALPLLGLPACIAGSTVAAEAYGLPLHDSSDVDVFCFTEQALIAAIQTLLAAGFTMSERFARVWQRWLMYGLRGWHTNSMKMIAPDDRGTEVNLVFKMIGGHPLSNTAAVVGSFDFGLLGKGYDLSTGTVVARDLRTYLFPGMSLTGPLPLMPEKHVAWTNGFISQYNGLREPGRYAKYVSYGHDLVLVKPALLAGYDIASQYLRDRGDSEKLKLAQIYEAIADRIGDDAIDELLDANAQLLTLDSYDQILEVLE